MKAGDRRMWHMVGTHEPVEVEVVRQDSAPGWWIVQPIGKPTAHFAHAGELRMVDPNDLGFGIGLLAMMVEARVRAGESLEQAIQKVADNAELRSEAIVALRRAVQPEGKQHV